MVNDVRAKRAGGESGKYYVLGDGDGNCRWVEWFRMGGGTGRLGVRVRLGWGVKTVR